jgi:hypothetical protein
MNGGDRGVTPEDERLLDQLVELWQSKCVHALEIRRQMGELLNQRLGPPDRRQPLGQKVQKLAGEQLQVSVSELSRMRWLDHFFPTVADLREKHPEIDSWTRFKQALPGLKPRRGERTATPAANRSSPALRGVLRSLGRVIPNLRRVGSLPAGPERDDLVRALRELMEVVKNDLGIGDAFA